MRLVSFIFLELSTSTKNIKPRLERIEKELVETKSSLLEILKNVSIITEELVHKDQKINPQNHEDLSGKLDIIFMSSNKQINDSTTLTNLTRRATTIKNWFRKKNFKLCQNRLRNFKHLDLIFQSMYMASLTI